MRGEKTESLWADTNNKHAKDRQRMCEVKKRVSEKMMDNRRTSRIVCLTFDYVQDNEC